MSINTSIHFKHNLLGKLNPGNCSLLLDISNNQGKLAIVDTSSGTLLLFVAALCTENDTIKDVLFSLKEKLPCEPNEFSGCKLMFYSSAFELVPDEWFIPDERDYYLILHQKEISTFPTNINHLIEFNIQLLSVVPPFVKIAMDVFNGVFRLYHSGAVFIDKFRKEYLGKKSVQKKVFCNFFSDGIEIFVPDNRKIRYYNQVITSDPMEALFFLLNTMQALDNISDYGIVFCGDITPKSELISTFKKAMPHTSLSFTVTAETEKYIKGSKSLNPLQLDNIIHLVTCE